MRSRACAASCRRAFSSRMSAREEIDGGPIVYYAVSTTGMTEEQLSWFVDDTINKRLLAVSGVAQVNRSGGVDREIRVDLDPARMQSFGITAAEVNEQLRQINVDAAGGRAQVGGSEQSIRVLGGARTAQQLADRRLPFGSPGEGRDGATRRHRRRARRHRRGAHDLEARRPAGDHLRRPQGQGRLRRRHAAAHRGGACQDQHREPGRPHARRCSPRSTSPSSSTTPRSRR